MRKTFFLIGLLSAVLFSQLTTTEPANSAPPDYVRVFIELPGLPNSTDDAAVRAFGGSTRHRFPTLNTISAEVPASIVPRLEQYSRFFNVRPVPQAEVDVDTLPWGVDRVDADVVWGGSQGAVNVQAGKPSGIGIKVAVVDTGSGPHADLSIAGRVNCITPTTLTGGCVSGGNDDHWHGTHVAGTIAALNNGSGLTSIAPNVSLYSVKVLNSAGSGYFDDIAAGILWAKDNDMDVVNMSLGCYTTPISGCNDPVMQSAVQQANSAGVLIVAAAGNSATSCSDTADKVGYPARYPEALAVAATDSNNARACFSSAGPEVDISGPGVNIVSTYLPGGTATASGTSMATPHVVGVAALVKSCKPSLTTSQLRSILQSTAINLGAANLYGSGLVQADAAVAGLVCDPPPTPVDNTAPEPPSFSSTSPASPGNDNTPEVRGGAEGGSTVSLYTDNACTSPLAASGAASSFASPGLTVTVGDNTTTTFWGTAEDAVGNISACSGGGSGSITYVEDSTAPQVQSTSPIDAATDVAVSTNISATFNEPMLTSSLNSSTFTLTGPGGAVSGTRLYSANTVSLDPSTNLQAGATYTATLTTGVKDAAGNSLTSSYVWSFTTVAAVGPTSTGFKPCTSQSAQTGSKNGDGNGFEVSPANACVNDSVFAADMNSGTSTATGCRNNGKDRHRFVNFNLNVPTGATINGIQVQLDGRIDSTSSSTRRFCVEVSWDGGTTWSTGIETTSLTTAEATYVLGSISETWGHNWTAAQLTNGSFRVRVTNVANSTDRDFYLDHLAVQVTYTP